MNPQLLLREYLRTARRVQRKPSEEGFKKLELLRFNGAHLCPSCSEEVVVDAYLVTREDGGGVSESYRCPACDSDFLFPQETMH